RTRSSRGASADGVHHHQRRASFFFQGDVHFLRRTQFIKSDTSKFLSHRSKQIFWIHRHCQCSFANMQSRIVDHANEAVLSRESLAGARRSSSTLILSLFAPEQRS